MRRAARALGKPCVSGAGSLRVDYAAATMSIAGQTPKKGDVITIDARPARCWPAAC
jgi:pyruvate,orthophosphate dikinase